MGKPQNGACDFALPRKIRKIQLMDASAAAAGMRRGGWRTEPALPRLPLLASLRFHVEINDVDNLRVTHTLPSVELQVDSHLGGAGAHVMAAAEPVGNSSVELVAYTPDAVMRQSGPHGMRIYLRHGWDHQRGLRADCILLEHMVEVEGVDSNWATTNAASAIGISAGISFVVLLVCCFFGYKWGHTKCLQTVLPGIGLSSRTVLFRN